MSSVTPLNNTIPGLHDGMPETKVITSLDGGADFFDTILDIVNPLQHIPIVSTIYRAITGDQIAGPARLIGGALFGGPLGFASALTNLVVEEASGRDLGDQVLALLAGDDTPSEVAAVSPAQQTTQQTAATRDVTSAAHIIWNGPRVAATRTAAAQNSVAALPAQFAGPKAQQVAANSAVAADDTHIVWSGPRIVPSLTRTATAPVASGDAPPETVTSANVGKADAPVWIGAALSDAQLVREAVDQGHAAPRPTAKPWIADAMRDALDKYEALARERNHTR